MTTPANPFDNREKIPGLSWTNKDETTGVMTPKPIGTRLGGKIVKAPEMVQQTDFDSNKPLFWKDQKKTTEETGSPAYTIVTTLETPEGNRSLWAPKSGKEGSMCRAISDAIKAAGAPTAVVGGELWITLTGLVPNPKGGQPSKTYSAVYTPPNQFAEAAPAAGPTPPASVPSPPAPPAPLAPAAEVKTPEGYTLASLVAGGWTAEQAIAAYPVLGNTTAPVAPPAPPAPPVADAGADARAAALAQLSPEDRALLNL